jgi:hypothetical protein
MEIANAVNGAIDYIKDHPNTRAAVHSLGKTWKDPFSFPIPGNMVDRRSPRLPIKPKLVNNILKYERIETDEGYGVEDFDYRLLFANINFNVAACREVGKDYAVRSLKDWKFMVNFPKMGFIVPSYFNESGCSRSDFNVGERLFVVVEFDSGTPLQQTKLHNYLNRTNPAFWLIMLVWSGNKSIHGWFATYGNSERRVITFQRRASELGADQTCVSPSAWIRMPNGWNYKHGTRQKVLYFDTELLGMQNEIVRKEIL